MSNQTIEDIILVIDDDISVREVLVMMIERSGYNVLGASSLKDALDKYKYKIKNEVRIILLDYSIPNENFFDTVTRINKDYKNIKLCVITGAIENKLKQKIMKESTVCEFITKPVKIDELQSILELILA